MSQLLRNLEDVEQRIAALIAEHATCSTDTAEPRDMKISDGSETGHHHRHQDGSISSGKTTCVDFQYFEDATSKELKEYQVARDDKIENMRSAFDHAHEIAASPSFVANIEENDVTEHTLAVSLGIMLSVVAIAGRVFM
jgi:hypothetical protein